MKKIVILFTTCLFFLLCCACTKNSKTYPFPNQDEPIEYIELLYYPYAMDVQNEERMKFELIRELKSEEISSFMEHLYELKTTQAIGSLPCDYGSYIVRVNYKNGDVEYFGNGHIEMVEAGDETCAVGIYYFPGDQFEKLFFEYAGDISYLENEQG